ncbi:MAG TPA: carboxymuconolactone decarboxylase family protein [Acidimicrobiales bacterium]|nr:carboxymuconolactone decarboxylase family protein [Acidimicrobiales bacterium]
MGRSEQVIAELREPTRLLRRAAPEAWAGFATLHDEAMKDGVLDARVKELMALVVAVVKRCDGCIAYHAKAAARRGATSAEVAEALSVALLMDGGPATTYGPRAFAAFQEFRDAQPAPGPRARPEESSQPVSHGHEVAVATP